MTKLTSFVVDRRTWLRGEGSDVSRLLRLSDGKMCCLGSASKAIGLTDEQIMEKISPVEVLTDDKSVFGGLIRWGGNSDYCAEIMSTNDADYLTDTVRETAITALFAQIGVKVTFIN